MHRDVKPSNIMIQRAGRGGTGRAYLTDFGIVKNLANASGLTQRGDFIGTYHYSSPEQIKGEALDGRSDQYSLACVFYECVTDRVPFDKPSPGEVMKAHVRDEPPSLRVERGEIPAALDPALARGLAKDRDDRYPNCLALVDALEAALQRPDGYQPTRPS